MMRLFTRKKAVAASFAFGVYRLDALLGDGRSVHELSAQDYIQRPRTFVGERIFSGPEISFAGHNWKTVIGAVNDRIYKLAAYTEEHDGGKATTVASDALSYCVGQLGEPDEQQSGLFQWQTSDGNVILQTAEAADGFAINVFATSRSVRQYQRL